jgi:hypothetical protein
VVDGGFRNDNGDFVQEAAERVRIATADYIGPKPKDFCGGQSLWEGQVARQKKTGSQP